jgi:sterol desaturase/sphingolipid hydroxylase (fatty acid hydroxylase superfamily)
MEPTLVGTIFAFLLLAAILWPIERFFPSIRGQPLWRGGIKTDLAYWFFTPLVTKALTRGALVVAVVLLAFAAGVRLDREHVQAFLYDPSRRVQRQPAGLQVLEVLLLGDLLGYWTHRLFHGRRLWPFHAVHHASKQLDWLSSVRLHPVNDAVSRLVSALPILLLGFSPLVLAGYVPFLTFYAILIHANVSWTFRPLRYLLASPGFHRWHHTSQEEGLDKNFAGLFPFIDLLFGTFYMPEGRRPERFGVLNEEVPEGLLGQLAYPFRRAAPPAAS